MMPFSPIEFGMLQQMLSRRQQPINIKIDLGGLKDLWGRHKITEEDESEVPTPMSVNLPRISPF